MTVSRNLCILFVGVLLVVPVGGYGKASGVGFSCSKALTDIEKTICADADLAAQDGELNALFNEIRKNSDADHDKTLLKGQRAWLKLRSTACQVASLPQDPGELADCLKSVYQDRLGQLRLTRDNQQRHMVGQTPLFDIEAMLDEERDLAAYAPGKISALHPLSPEKGPVSEEAVLPRTCRELFTLKAGLWGYGGDTIGENSRGTAVTRCLYSAYRVQNHRLLSGDGARSFSDPSKYSSEFACLPAGCRTGSGYDRSFHLDKIKALKPDGSLENGKGRRDLHLNGMNYSLTVSEAGDYTGHGREEAIIAIDYYPDQGTLRGHLILLAHYDPASGLIRPEEISDNAGLQLKLEQDEGQ